MSRVEEGGLREEAGQGAPRLLSITELDLSLVERVRASTSTEAIEDYAAQLDHLPLIRMALVDDRHVVVGGLHRVRAHQREGRLEIPCIIESMTWAEAVRSAVADNRTHGLRMTRADKRVAITLLLAEDPDLSSRAIADLVGCSHSTVETVRTLAVGPPAFSGPDETQVANLASCSPLEAEVPSPAAPQPSDTGMANY
jgi:ParB-like chromosome segregation protein Spo0J